MKKKSGAYTVCLPMFQLYQDTASLVDKFGYDNAIDYLQWQIDCVHDMKEKAKNLDDEELYA